MANLRIRLEADTEVYLRSQSDRVLGIPSTELNAADVTTLANRIIYEHKLAQAMMRQEFIPRLLGWLKGIMPGGATASAALPEPKKEIAAQAPDLDLAADFAAQFDDAA